MPDTVRRKAFVGPTFYRNFKDLNSNRDMIRDQAEAYVNEFIGAENVISITEHAMTIGPFSVVVWYRAEATSPAPAELR